MKTTTLYWIGGAIALVGGGTAIYFATRPAAGSGAATPPPNQQVGKGTNAPATKPAPSYVASANMAELGSFAAWLANNPPPALDPNTGDY